uniref:ORF15 n=1 Tax=Malaco herpesvirus 4 TaxID=3031800 RepID=A0AA48SIL0_9VIRU|nr:TPA_asm: ORF15 [Malaco herpesvirus 4]
MLYTAHRGIHLDVFQLLFVCYPLTVSACATPVYLSINVGQFWSGVLIPSFGAYLFLFPLIFIMTIFGRTDHSFLFNIRRCVVSIVTHLLRRIPHLLGIHRTHTGQSINIRDSLEASAPGFKQNI